MATLTTVEKAPILDQAGLNLTSSNAQIAISDTAIVTAVLVAGKWYASAGVPGTATITATRLADGSTATLDVTVVAATPFAISLGTAVPK